MLLVSRLCLPCHAAIYSRLTYPFLAIHQAVCIDRQTILLAGIMI
jgi:hypothetical protein